MTSFGLYQLAAAHLLYLTLAGAGVWYWLRTLVGAGPLEAAVCSLPALLCLALAFTSQQDQEQYVLRLAAAAMFTPMLLLFWSNSVGLPIGRMLAAGLLHLLCCAASVLWLGTRTTRIAPPAGVAPVDATTLQARLLSFNATGAPLHVTSPSAGELIVVFRHPSPDRSYRLLLNLDAATHYARVRERASANLARPARSSEKSMRSIGDPSFDPARPAAQRVSETVLQVTPIRPNELAAMPVTWQGTAAALPADFAEALDERGVATLLCAVVTRSGWHWRPAFFGAQ